MDCKGHLYFCVFPVLRCPVFVNWARIYDNMDLPEPAREREDVLEVGGGPRHVRYFLHGGGRLGYIRGHGAGEGPGVRHIPHQLLRPHRDRRFLRV